MLKRLVDRSEMSLAGLGFDLAASVAVATALGWWIDRRWETEPWGVILCAAIGIVGGLTNFVRAAQRSMRERDAGRGPGSGAEPENHGGETSPDGERRA